MNLPTVITSLVKAQNNNDNAAYADCFTENATVFDEGKSYSGKQQIKEWAESTAKEYNLAIKPKDYTGDSYSGIFKAEVSGTFPGSPIMFSYELKFDGDLIKSLEISI